VLNNLRRNAPLQLKIRVPRKKLKKKADKGMPMSSYITMPHYAHHFPVQVEIIKRMNPKKQRKKK